MEGPGPDHKGKTPEEAGDAEAKQVLAERLIQAGLYRRDSVGHYMLMKGLMAIGPIVLGILLGFTGLITLLQGVVAGAVTGLLGTLVPSLWLDRRKRARQMQIRRAMPDDRCCPNTLFSSTAAALTTNMRNCWKALPAGCRLTV